MSQFWYLGLDFGTSHLRAVLINAQRQRQYPLFWELGGEPSFGLPTTVLGTGNPVQPWAIAEGGGLVAEKTLEGWKAFLRLAPSYLEGAEWYPKLPWSRGRNLSLKAVEEALTFLLCILRDRSLTADLSPLRVRDILGSLAGVIVNVPTAWDDTYRLNVREALKQAGLIAQAEQVVFVSGAIATLLGFQAQLPPAAGQTLVIYSGESHTDLAVVDVPDYFPQLTHAQIHSHSFDYGGSALEQDILCQLIYPQWLPQLADNLQAMAKLMPRAGELDPDYRLLAAWQWRNSPIGRSLLRAAHQTKRLLQQRAEFTAHLGQQRWQVTREDLERQIIYPFREQLNQQVNHLLAISGATVQGIQHIIVAGTNGDYCWQWLEPWLAQKFPQAHLLRDATPPAISRIAVGLGLVPLLPNIVDGDRHRYHDYCLLGTVLKALSPEPFSLDSLQRQLQSEGINARHCGERLEAILNSQRPAGLAPDVDEQLSTVFLDYPLGNSPASALCWRETDALYHLHEAQRDHLQHYWTVLQQSYQIGFDEPYSLPFQAITLQLGASEP